MKEQAINFNADMVRAILDGRKTQTRRIMKPQPASDIAPHNFPNPSAHFCPFGQAGDRLWVRESFQFHSDLDLYGVKEIETETLDVLYVADRPDSLWDAKVRPPLHMPRWASRITLGIESVRVERLQDISEANCRKEGIFTPEIGYANLGKNAPIIQFGALWESIYGVDCWYENPWVWVIDFKKITNTADGE